MASKSSQNEANRDEKPTIAFIGGGNMAEAIIGGLQASGHPHEKLRYSEPMKERREYMEEKYPKIKGVTNNVEAVQGADIVVFAVKPQVMRDVIIEEDFNQELHKNHGALLVSIVAGIKTVDILHWVGNKKNPPSLVRVMPNTPCLIGEGAAGMFASGSLNETQKQAVENMLGSVSKRMCWVDQEEKIDAVTGVSGSGPAYFFLMMEAMQKAGVEAGLTPEDSRQLTLQTCLGAARMAIESEDDLATLRHKVTSPNGTTQAAIEVMKEAMFSIMNDGVSAATKRSSKIAEEFGEKASQPPSDSL